MKKSTIYISHMACMPLMDYLNSKGHSLEISTLVSLSLAGSPIESHPDLLHCSLGFGTVFHGEPSLIGKKYPSDCIYNGCCTGKFFIHNLDITCDALKQLCYAQGIELIHTAQGYSRCSALPVDENSIITYDRGLANACLKNGGPEVLLIRPDFVLLPGFNTGFIGGTGGRIDDEIVFNGDISAHPDYAEIKDFILSRGLSLTFFENEPLTDIGSIIQELQ